MQQNLHIYSSKNVKIKIYVTIIVFYERETWSFTLREGHRLSIGCWGRYLDRRRRWRWTGGDCIRRCFMMFIPHQIIFRWSNQKEWDWGEGGGHVASVFWWVNLRCWDQLEDLDIRADNIKMDLKEMRACELDWSCSGNVALVSTVVNTRVP